MFEIGWSEMLVIAIVLIVVVGPKDLPKMLRTFGKTVAKLRGMAGDFQKQFSEALKEAELDDVKKSFDDIRGINPVNDIKKSLNPFEKAAADVRAGLDKALRPDAPVTASPVAHPAEPLKAGPDLSPAGPSPEISTVAPAGLVAATPPVPTPSVIHPAEPLKNGSGDTLSAAVIASAAKPGHDTVVSATSRATEPAKTSAVAVKAKSSAPSAKGSTPLAKTVAPRSSSSSTTKATASKVATGKATTGKVEPAKPASGKPAAADHKTIATSKSAAVNGAKRQGSSK